MVISGNEQVVDVARSASSSEAGSAALAAGVSVAIFVAILVVVGNFQVEISS
jgi:hypothetical protein